MSLWRWIRRNGLRRGMQLWRVQRRFQSTLQVAAYVKRNQPEFRVHHGERPRLTGYRRGGR